ncbi:7591_t:CDS:1, partial [Dentiscutata heterogama]
NSVTFSGSFENNYVQHNLVSFNTVNNINDLRATYDRLKLS